MKKNLLLIFIVFLLAVVPLVMVKGAKFGGSDDQAKNMITQIQPGYRPWFNYLWKPPSSEVESLLFSVQAALGAGFIGYFIGYSKGRKNREEQRFHDEH